MPMPDTEQVELRTDTIEDLVDILTSDERVMSQDRRRAVADRLRRQTTSPDAVAFCGLPGAGKSFTAKKLGKVYNAPVVSMGDAIRHEYKEQNWLGKVESSVPESIPSDKLGEFASEWRADDPEGIPEKVAELAAETGGELVTIDGVRSITDYEVLNDFFDDFYLIEVKAEFYHRLSRLQKRGREGEEDFSPVDLAERDERELHDLGFQALSHEDYIDLTVKNGTGSDALGIRLSEVVENNLPFEIANGKPLGLDDELEKMRQAQKVEGYFED